MIHPFKGHIIIHPAFLLTAENNIGVGGGGGGRVALNERLFLYSFSG